MLCTAFSSVLEYNFFSFIAGVVLTTVFFVRRMFKNRKKRITEN